MDAISALQQFGGGEVLQDLYDALEITASEVVETGNPGAVTVSFKLSNQGIGDISVFIEPDVSRKPPKHSLKGTYVQARNGQMHPETSPEAAERTVGLRDVIPPREEDDDVALVGAPHEAWHR